MTAQNMQVKTLKQQVEEIFPAGYLTYLQRKKRQTRKFIPRTTPPRKSHKYQSYPTFFEFEPTDYDNEPNRIGDLFVDFDSDQNIALAILETIAVIKYFSDKYGIPETEWRISFSGGKGVHLRMKASVLGLESGRCNLPLIYKNLMREVVSELDLKTADLSIYNMKTGKPFRLENHKRENGNYEVPVYLSDLTFENHDSYIKSPRKLPDTRTGALCESLRDKVTGIEEELKKSKYKNEGRYVDLSIFEEEVPPCLEIILKNREVKGDTNFNSTAMTATRWFFSNDIEFEEAMKVGLFRKFVHEFPSGSLKTERDREENIRNRFSSMSLAGAEFGCGFPRSNAKDLGVSLGCNICPWGEVEHELNLEQVEEELKALGQDAKESQWLDVLEKGEMLEDREGKKIAKAIFGGPGKARDFNAALKERTTKVKRKAQRAKVKKSATPKVGLLVDSGAGQWNQTEMKLKPQHKALEVLLELCEDNIIVHESFGIPYSFTGKYWEMKDKGFFEGEILETIQMEAAPMDWKYSYFVGLYKMVSVHPALRKDPVKLGVVPFNNGILTVKTGEFNDITLENATTWVLPYNYDKDATCEKFLKWLDWALEGDEGSIKMVQAFFNLCLQMSEAIGEDNQKYLELVGGSGTGKSTFVRILRNLLTSNSIATTTFKALQSDNHETARIRGKALLIISEGEWQGNIDTFKAITGRDPLRDRRMNTTKGEDSIFRGQTIVAANSFVKTKDSSGALDRRRISLRFDKAPTEKEVEAWEKGGGEKAIFAESPGIVNWALEMNEKEALKALKQTKSKRVENYKLEGAKADSNLLQWMMETLVIEKDHILQVGMKQKEDSYGFTFYYEGKRLYPTYCRWAINTGVKMVSLRNFTEELKTLMKRYSYGKVVPYHYRPNNKSQFMNVKFWEKGDKTWQESWEESKN